MYKAAKGSDDLKLYAGGAHATDDMLVRSNFAHLNVEHPTVIKHDREFLQLIAHEYYSIAAETTRRFDPEHLLLGDRYIGGDHPAEVLEEAIKYVDIISVQPEGITFDRGYFDRLHTQTNTPIMIATMP